MYLKGERNQGRPGCLRGKLETIFTQEDFEMKKFLAVIAIVATVALGVVGNAAAAFETLHLIRSVYNGDPASTLEKGSDLGLNLFSTVGAYGNNVQAGDMLSGLSGQVNDLYVSYWGRAADATNTGIWIASTSADGLQLASMKGAGMNGSFDSVQALYGLGGTSTVTVDKTSMGSQASYFNKFDQNTPGKGGFGGSLSVGYYTATASLAGLHNGSGATPWLTEGAYVDMYLYYFDYKNAKLDGTQVAVLRTYLDADGNIGSIINPTGGGPVVPIPGAVWLLGSGLLGLIGIRRRQTA